MKKKKVLFLTAFFLASGLLLLISVKAQYCPTWVNNCPSECPDYYVSGNNCYYGLTSYCYQSYTSPDVCSGEPNPTGKFCEYQYKDSIPEDNCTGTCGSGPDGCKWRDYECTSSGVNYTDYDVDTSQTYCEACVGPVNWNLNGNNQCCGDDSNEYNKTCIDSSGNSNAACGTDTDACCDANTDCVDQNGNCRNSGACYGSSVFGNSYCNAGTWEDPDENSSYCPASCGTWMSSVSKCCGDDGSADDFCGNGYESCLNGVHYTNGDSNSWTCECGVAGTQGNCNVNGETGCWNPSGTGEKRCCGDDGSADDFCMGGFSACVNGYYRNDGDYNSYVCNCGGGYWNIGGEVAATTCCGDDSGEYKRTRVCIDGICTTNSSDDACCDADTDCVYEDTCYPNGYVGDVDSDGEDEKCYSGTWMDIIPPTYSLNSTNSTLAGKLIEFRLKWNDNLNLSGFIFSFDNCTGYFVNDTWQAFTSSMCPDPYKECWTNVTKLVNSTIGCTIRWKVYANDSADNWNISQNSFKTTGAWLNVSLIAPNASECTEASACIWGKYHVYWINASIRCEGYGEACEDVNGTARYNGTAINTSEDTPFYIISGPNPQACGSLNPGESCTLSWKVNVTGDLFTYWSIDVKFNSTNPVVKENDTQNAIIRIMDLDAPLYSNVGSNVTQIKIGDSILLYSYWEDNEALSHAFLATDESGSWKNYTDGTYNSPYDFNGVKEGWSNFTWINTSIKEYRVIHWKIWANDSSGLESVTDTKTFIVNPKIIITIESERRFGNKIIVKPGNSITIYGRAYYEADSSSYANKPIYFSYESIQLGSNFTNSTGHYVFHFTLPEGTYALKAKTEDSLGNKGENTTLIFITYRPSYVKYRLSFHLGTTKTNDIYRIGSYNESVDDLDVSRVVYPFEIEHAFVCTYDKTEFSEGLLSSLIHSYLKSRLSYLNFSTLPSNSAYTLELKQMLDGSSLLIAFTKGGCELVEEKMYLVEDQTIPSKALSSFIFGAPSQNIFEIIAKYDRIELEGNLTFSKGIHSLCIGKTGVSDAYKPVIEVRKC